MRIGMVFQKPNPFPKSIYENVAYGLRIRGQAARSDLDERVERALQEAALWDEVKDRLHALASTLSGGQQQRSVYCHERWPPSPEMLLFDEPSFGLGSNRDGPHRRIGDGIQKEDDDCHRHAQYAAGGHASPTILRSCTRVSWSNVIARTKFSRIHRIN